MPGKTDIAQGEMALREARRSDPSISCNSKLGLGSTRRTSVSENVSMNTAGRRSPRLGGGAGAPCTAQPRLARTSTGARVGGALNDITNVAARPGQAYGKTGKQPLSGQASVPLPGQPPVPHAPTGIRQLTARGQGEAPSHVPAPVAANVPSHGLPALASLESPPFQGADANNAQSVHEYAPEIYALLFRDEVAQLPSPNYMETQTDINGKMRAILIDWLIEVHMKYRLRSETLFLTVNLIDRYLSQRHVMRKKLQLVGVVAMFIAAKFEEINPPEINDFVHITDNAYTKEDVLLMECTMLTTLNFKIVVPTVAPFLEQLQKVNRCDDVHRELAGYLIELGLLEIRMLRFPPSQVVSAALLLSNELLSKRPVWPQTMVHHSRHSEQVLRPCCDELRELFEAAPKAQLQAVKKKFSLPQRHGVAKMTF